MNGARHDLKMYMMTHYGDKGFGALIEHGLIKTIGKSLGIWVELDWPRLDIKTNMKLGMSMGLGIELKMFIKVPFVFLWFG